MIPSPSNGTSFLTFEDNHFPAAASLGLSPLPPYRSQQPHPLTSPAVKALSGIEKTEDFLASALHAPRVHTSANHAKAINDFIQGVLPRPDIESLIFEHLISAKERVDVQIGMSLIRDHIHKDAITGYQILAQHINTYKIALNRLHLTKKELKEIAPYLLHLNFGDFLDGNDFHSWDSQQIHELIEACPLLQTLQIHLPRLTSLPPCVAQLTSLDCSRCNSLESLPDNMNSLEHFKCSNCPKLPLLPKGMKKLKTLDCSWNESLASLPDDMDALVKLNCSASKLKSLPQNMTVLRKLQCQCCNQLTFLPRGMKALCSLTCTGCVNLECLPDDLPLNVIIEQSGCVKLPFINI